ncbi:hypothetical protein P7K49_020881 [Saguinus oedipus]|uniref:Uncharacterized protein n=1 Tax=Saguinus oedipus TaxID=9490 RepID=A0ABQ9USQ9_SAGOE|nr:hypothetical protein P7K49_020881 [Saguinus oedipus]
MHLPAHAPEAGVEGSEEPALGLWEVVWSSASQRPSGSTGPAQLHSHPREKRHSDWDEVVRAMTGTPEKLAGI